LSFACPLRIKSSIRRSKSLAPALTASWHL
jgi:hypothetical protein